MEAFTPTHVITLNGREIPVLVDDGAAYTKAEWDAESKADWTVNNDGEFVFQGRVPTGVYSIREVTTAKAR